MDAPRPRLRTRLALFILPVLLIVTLAAWAFAHWKLVSITYKFAESVPPGATHGEPDWWTLRSRRFTVLSFGGRLLLASGETRSLAPVASELGTSADLRGWETHIFSRAGVNRDQHPAIYWNNYSDFSFFGLGTFSSVSGGETVRAIGIPYWFIAGFLTGLTLLVWLPHRRRRERAAAGRCIRCGYDLRSTAEGAPCPECGHERIDTL
jgi:hypothetical protein